MAEDKIRIIVFSDDSTRRADVMNAVGNRVTKDGPSIEWKEIATGKVALLEVQSDTRYDLAILDGETKGLGGAGVARMMNDEIAEDQVNYGIPTINLVARQQDEWISRWSGASRTLLYPVDPKELAAAVRELVA